MVYILAIVSFIGLYEYMLYDLVGPRVEPFDTRFDRYVELQLFQYATTGSW